MDELNALREALEKIAGSHFERTGHCQTDVEEIPDLTAEDAMREARKALSHPSGKSLQDVEVSPSDRTADVTVEGLALFLAYHEWPLATETEKLSWAEKHSTKHEPLACALLDAFTVARR